MCFMHFSKQIIPAEQDTKQVAKGTGEQKLNKRMEMPLKFTPYLVYNMYNFVNFALCTTSEICVSAKRVLCMC